MKMIDASELTSMPTVFDADKVMFAYQEGSDASPTVVIYFQSEPPLKISGTIKQFLQLMKKGKV